MSIYRDGCSPPEWMCLELLAWRVAVRGQGVTWDGSRSFAIRDKRADHLRNLAEIVPLSSQEVQATYLFRSRTVRFLFQ